MLRGKYIKRTLLLGKFILIGSFWASGNMLLAVLGTVGLIGALVAYWYLEYQWPANLRRENARRSGSS